MKDAILLCILSIILVSCGREHTSGNSENPMSNQQRKDSLMSEVGESKDQYRSIYKTQSGKEFELLASQVSSSLVDLRVLTRGFEIRNDSMVIRGADPVSNAFVSDLDENGYDEFYVITTSAGSGSYATILGLASNRDKSVSRIYVREISGKDLAPGGLMEGYMGHDSIYLSDKKLMRTFPVYNPGDKNCCPTGGVRTLHYELKAGEASWILEAKNN